MLRILNLIRLQSQPALIEFELVPVRWGDPTQITNTLNQLLSKVVLDTNSTRFVSGGPGGPTQVNVAQQTTASQPTNVVLIPQPRLGSILVATSKAA